MKKIPIIKSFYFFLSCRIGPGGMQIVEDVDYTYNEVQKKQEGDYS